MQHEVEVSEFRKLDELGAVEIRDRASPFEGELGAGYLLIDSGQGDDVLRQTDERGWVVASASAGCGSRWRGDAMVDAGHVGDKHAAECTRVIGSP